MNGDRVKNIQSVDLQTVSRNNKRVVFIIKFSIALSSLGSDTVTQCGFCKVLFLFCGCCTLCLEGSFNVVSSFFMDTFLSCKALCYPKHSFCISCAPDIKELCVRYERAVQIRGALIIKNVPKLWKSP